MKRWPWSAIVLWSALPWSVPLPAAAQAAAMVRDINTAPPRDAIYAHQIVSLGSKVLFTFSDNRQQGNLWVTDGTAGGTGPFVDACGGTCGGLPSFLGQAGGLTYFVTGSETRETAELWRSDGTRRGSFVVARSSNIRGLAVRGNLALFVACSAPRVCKLWRTDGSVAGTRAVAPAGPNVLLDPFALTVLGDKVYFFGTSTTPLHYEVWGSDGTAAGTTLVRAFPDFFAESMAAAAGRLFLLFGDPAGGQHLWTSDGTARGTREVTHFADPQILYPTLAPLPTLLPYSGGVHYLAEDGVHGDEVWASDGTLAGTRRVTDLAPAIPFPNRSGADELTGGELADLGGRLAFLAADGANGFSLWSTDRSPASTARLTPPGVTADGPLFKLGSRAVFTASEGQAPGIWSSDGTAAGTRKLAALCPTCFPGPASVGSRVFFTATDPVHGNQIWTTDGTPSGTRRFTDLPAGTAPGGFDLVALGDGIAFEANDPLGLGVWTSDGTPGGTRQVAHPSLDGASSFPEPFAALADRLLFWACGESGGQLWATTGTDAAPISAFPRGGGECTGEGIVLPPLAVGQTVLFQADGGLWTSDGRSVTQVEDLTGIHIASGFVPFAGGFFFLVQGAGGSVDEIWRSDGTTAAPRKVVELPPEAGSAAALLAASDALYFTAGASSGQIWASDGTAAGTRFVFGPAGFSPSQIPVAAGSTVFFFGFLDGGEHLWRTDGTTAGTEAVADFTLPQTVPLVSVATSTRAELAGKLFFALRFLDNTAALWVSDGTRAGTFELRRFLAEIRELTAFGGRVVFNADDGLHGRELWTSDGTAAGTVLAADLLPGPDPGDPQALAVAAGRLFFSADDGVHGFELWQSDGTAAGSRRLTDVAPEAASAFPRKAMAAGERLYFAADDGIHGEELWTLPLAAGGGGAGGCQPAADHLCLGGGRFRVEADWLDFQGHAGRGTAVPLTGDTGYFWFFSPSNVEVAAKVLDGRGLNQAFWVFYGALSSVEYTLTVTDTGTGLSRRYRNPPGELASVGDTRGFGPLGAFDVRRDAAPPVPAGPPATLVSARTEPAAATGSCLADARTLCLSGGRFRVAAAWKDFQGHAGDGTAVPLTGDTGYFWFFDPANVELVAKVLDGRAVNQKFWFFYGALSSVEYTLTVTDTQTGAVKTYRNPSGHLASVADTGAF